MLLQVCGSQNPALPASQPFDGHELVILERLLVLRNKERKKGVGAYEMLLLAK